MLKLKSASSKSNTFVFKFICSWSSLLVSLLSYVVQRLLLVRVLWTLRGRALISEEGRT